MQRPLAFVIEDQPSLSTLYEDALRLVGFDVIAIRDGLQALNKLEISDPPTLIILDINLPGLSGRDLHKHIRKHRRYDQTPVMILTANSVMATAIQPEITSNDHLFIKPISMKELQNFAKLMRPGKDGVPQHKAETQEVRALPTLLEDDEDTLKVMTEILTPDDALTVDSPDLKPEEKLVSKEHKVIITPDDKVISSETDAKLADDTAEDKTTIAQTDSSSTETTEAAKADDSPKSEKASDTKSEAESNDKAESK